MPVAVEHKLLTALVPDACTFAQTAEVLREAVIIPLSAGFRMGAYQGIRAALLDPQEQALDQRQHGHRSILASLLAGLVQLGGNDDEIASEADHLPLEHSQFARSQCCPPEYEQHAPT